MKAEVVTTIRTLIDLDTLEPEHEVTITASDVPEVVARAAAEGAARSLLTALGVSE